ncbi:MAG: ABC transporter permease [Clostridium sp.]|nr:ABC transporter permease [Clostridium sp.]
MAKSKISIIIWREFAERVKKKSFIITTILMPVLMVALMCLPALLMIFAGDDDRTYLVVDTTDERLFAEGLESGGDLTFINSEAPLDSALRDRAVDGIIFFPSDILTDRKSSPRLYNNGSASMSAEQLINNQINHLITEHRISSYDVPGLKEMIADIESNLSLQTFENTEAEEDQQASSTTLSYILGIGLSLLLYMSLLIYGQMVMTSIIEEKNNRVLELVVTSVKPFQLMLGKIAGVGLVAVTQLLIWGILIAVGAMILLPALLPEEAAMQVASMQAGTLDPAGFNGDEYEMIGAIARFSQPGWLASLFGWLILFLVGGFLLYASIFAAIGSAVDNIQDASQFTSFAVVPIILGIVFGQAAAANPGSALSLWTSFIPLTSPMVMMSRLPFGVDTWETLLSAVILFLSVILFVWIAGKIYRIGIFMYGKKPTVRDLIRWARYK